MFPLKSWDGHFHHHQQSSFSTIWAYRLWSGPGMGCCQALRSSVYNTVWWPASVSPILQHELLGCQGRDSGLPIYILSSFFLSFFLPCQQNPQSAQLQNHHFRAFLEARRPRKFKRMSSGRTSRKAPLKGLTQLGGGPFLSLSFLLPAAWKMHIMRCGGMGAPRVVSQSWVSLRMEAMC